MPFVARWQPVQKLDHVCTCTSTNIVSCCRRCRLLCPRAVSGMTIDNGVIGYDCRDAFIESSKLEAGWNGRAVLFFSTRHAKSSQAGTISRAGTTCSGAVAVVAVLLLTGNIGMRSVRARYGDAMDAAVAAVDASLGAGYYIGLALAAPSATSAADLSVRGDSQHADVDGGPFGCAKDISRKGLVGGD